MMILGLFLSLAGIVLFAWTMARLASFALPVWLGVAAFVWCAKGDAGVLVGVILGLAVAVATFLLGRLAMASRLPLALRGLVAMLFAVPAGIAGYSVVSGLLTLGGAGSPVTNILAGMGALATGVAALATLYRTPPSSEPSMPFPVSR